MDFKKTTVEQFLQEEAKAQKEYEKARDEYYLRNNDGGSYDELYAIAFKIAKKYGIEAEDIFF